MLSTCSLDSFCGLCEKRRSIRYFDTTPVSREDINEVIEAARLAPSVENTQPWRFHVVLHKGLLEQLTRTACYGNFIAGASAFILVTCDQRMTPSTGETLWNPRELEFSCVAAMEHLVLAATAKGLGSCWVSLHHGPAHDILKLPTHETVIGGIMLGHPRKGEEEPSGPHERRPLSGVVTFHE
ncbi:MAG: nitroreductase [Candidatus Peregrinibacteria bacterium Gr01-1014_25]|nr:MAG: nitroreductase [Candidatus Peregrinibacteria bacterium Gr01-1014_25]